MTPSFSESFDVTPYLIEADSLNPSPWAVSTHPKYQLGDGASGMVYRAEWTKGASTAAVAVKTLKLVTKRASNILLQEVNRMIEFSHRNIVRVHGVCVDGLSVAIIMELALGSLHKILRDTAAYPSIPWSNRLHILLCIVDGLHLLHSKKYVHRDLKSLNILIRFDWSACLADFGDTKISDPTYTQTLNIGSPLWQPPEVETGHYGDFSDIYSFGIIMYEVLTRKLPFHEVEFKNMEMLRSYVKKGGRPSLQKLRLDCPNGYVELMQKCWSQDPENRPKIANLKKVIQDMMKLAK